MLKTEQTPALGNQYPVIVIIEISMSYERNERLLDMMIRFYITKQDTKQK